MLLFPSGKSYIALWAAPRTFENRLDDVRGLSGKYPAILDISRKGRVALM